MPLIGCGSDRAALSTAPTQSAAPQLAATGLHVTTADSGSGHPQISGEARVSSLVAGTSCPALSFMIGASRVSVTAATTYRGGTCTDIAPGTKVKLEGMKDNNNITATSVEIEDRENNDDDNDAEHHEAEGEGVITGLATGTSCPALEFLIGSHRIATRASTVFEGGVCADLHVSTRVHVKGTLGANGTVTAMLVRIQSESPGHPEVEGEARVSSLVAGTACPTLKFK